MRTKLRQKCMWVLDSFQVGNFWVVSFKFFHGSRTSYLWYGSGSRTIIRIRIQDNYTDPDPGPLYGSLSTTLLVRHCTFPLIRPSLSIKIIPPYSVKCDVVDALRTPGRHVVIFRVYMTGQQNQSILTDISWKRKAVQCTGIKKSVKK